MRGVVERREIDTELRCELRERPTLAGRCPLTNERDNLVILPTKVGKPRVDEGKRDGSVVECVDADVELMPHGAVLPVVSVTMEQRDTAVDRAMRDVPVGVLSITGVRVVRGQHANPMPRALGTDPRALTVAENIKTGQTAEISAMKSMQARMGCE